MARRDMHEARAGLVGDEVTGKHRHLELIALAAQGMRGDQSRGNLCRAHATQSSILPAAFAFSASTSGEQELLAYSRRRALATARTS